MKSLILICVMATTALAAPGADRKHAEALEAEARASHDDAKYVAAAQAYVEAYNASADAPDGDELLYNAGVLFEEGHATSAALQVFAQLEARYPRSKLGARALARTARLYADVAMFDRAALKLEDYAKKYAADKDAYDALSDAVYYRRALGDRAKAVDDTRSFIKTYGAKHPREAADAAWLLITLFEDDPAGALAALRDYLREFAPTGGAERVVIANAKIGQLLWQQSCPGVAVDGLCVRIDDVPRTCGAGTARTWSRRARDPRTAKEALAAFASAIAEYERRLPDDPGARYYYAQARLAVADGELESYLALAFPTGLAFDPADAAARTASVKRFAAWVDQKQKLGASVSRRYEDVLTVKDAAGAVGAAERLGLVTQSFASTLVSAELPRRVRTGARATIEIKAYCDAMTQVADALQARAVEVFEVCLDKSTQLGWFSDASRMCEAELGRLVPDRFPRALEIHRAPLVTATVVTSEPPLR